MRCLADMRSPTPEQIRHLRRKVGLTQAACAALVCSTAQSWQRWESGATPMHPGLWKLFRIEVGMALDPA